MDHQFSADQHHAKDQKPGAKGKTGEFMHPTGNLSSATKVPLVKRLMKRELLPILPLFLAVGTGVALAGWSAHRQLIRQPEIRTRLNKDRRSGEVPEIDNPEEMADRGKQYLEKTMIRDTLRKPVFAPVLRFFSVPSQSKEDEAIHSQAKEKSGKMSLEPPKGRVQT